MNNRTLIFLAVLAALPLSAQAADTAPAKGKLIFEARLRNEQVNDDAFAKDANATTLRMRLGYKTAVHSGWSGVVEFEGTQHLGSEHFNSTANGQTAYPSVVDPDNTELNQLYANYQPSDATRVTFGRQRLQYDNQRFIGNSGWRQNEQTFDALDFQHKFSNGLSLRYSYLDRVQRVNGDDNPNRNLARWQLDAHLLSLAHTLGPGTLTGYGYFIDNQTLPTTSHRDLGLRYVAKHDAPDAIGWQFAAEFARQDSYANGSSLIGANYYLLEGGVTYHGNTFKAGHEVLGGDGHYAFQTPLATLHAFDGWADRFLTTPVNGLEDNYLGWNRKFGKLTATVTWHDFRSDHASIHYGQEWDASLGWAFAPHWTALAKLADYRHKDVGADVTKTWLSVEYVY